MSSSPSQAEETDSPRGRNHPKRKRTTRDGKRSRRKEQPFVQEKTTSLLDVDVDLLRDNIICFLDRRSIAQATTVFLMSKQYGPHFQLHQIYCSYHGQKFNEEDESEEEEAEKGGSINVEGGGNPEDGEEERSLSSPEDELEEEEIGDEDSEEPIDAPFPSKCLDCKMMHEYKERCHSCDNFFSQDELEDSDGSCYACNVTFRFCSDCACVKIAECAVCERKLCKTCFDAMEETDECPCCERPLCSGRCQAQCECCLTWFCLGCVEGHKHDCWDYVYDEPDIYDGEGYHSDVYDGPPEQEPESHDDEFDDF